MRLMLIAASVVILAQSSIVVCGQLFSGHKSDAEVARMTPEQRVQEYCREYFRHYVLHDYCHLLHSYVMTDGLRAVPALTRIIGEYDPTTPAGRSKEKAEWFDAAVGLLVDIDQTVVRLRASHEGRAAIAATKKAIERMRAAGFHNNDKYKDDLEYDKRTRYELAVDDYVQRMEGLSWLDKAIGDTLRVKFNIRLTHQELLDFVSYLISKDPYYPDGIGLAIYKDFSDLNEAGNPRQYYVVPYIEPFLKAYREYKSKHK